MQELISPLMEQLSNLAKPDRAKQMADYMKGRHVYYGVPSPARKSIFAQWYKTYKPIIIDEFRAVSKALYSCEHRELHYCAIDLLIKQKKKLGPEDIDFVHWLITTHSWWESVDAFASHLVGELFKDKELRDFTTQQWMASQNIWLQRSCIISQLKYKEDTDLDYLITLIDATYRSKEFFIQKANGWALRQASKFYAEDVFNYLETKDDWPRVTLREAEKYL